MAIQEKRSQQLQLSQHQEYPAEWVGEAPSSYSGVLPLANFGQVTFSSCTTNIGTGAPQTIASFGPMATTSGTGYDAITMVTSSGATKAAPSGLDATGAGFSVTWKSAGP